MYLCTKVLFKEEKMDYDNTLLYCRSCKHKINAETEKCPQCGAEDPFYFVKTKKIKKSEFWRALLSMFIAFIITEFLDPKSTYVSITCFIILGLILMAIFEMAVKYTLKEDEKNYSEEFKKICDEANDEVAFNVWKSKMDNIIG